MLKHRVIPALLLQDGGLVKTRRFKKPIYVGDPTNAIRIFNEKEVDELMVLDISASKKNHDPDYKTIELLAGECFMPLCYGGGVNSLEQAARILDLGVEKICVQTAALKNINFISELAERFGSQSIMVSIDVKRNWLKRPCLYESRREKISNRGWLEFARQAAEAGAGELLLTAVDRDGEMSGYDTELIKALSSEVTVPVIGLGGGGSLNDMKAAIQAGASAVAAGAMFVFHGPHRAVLITYPRYQDLERTLERQE